MDTFSWKKLLRHRAAMIGLAVLGMMFAMAALGAPAHLRGKAMQETRPEIRLQAPGSAHWLGTDGLGRDVFRRLCIGAALSLGIAVAVVIFALMVGVPVGAISAFQGGWLDLAVMRVVDMTMAFPSILLAMTIMAAWGRGADKMVIAIAIPLIPGIVRQVRAAVLAQKSRDYATAARALGARPMRILFRELLPNAMGPILVITTFSIGTAILDIAGLSFLGLGVAAGQPEWGTMLQEARTAVSVDYREWWVIVFPGAAIAMTVLGFNLLGDGLRDVLDPRGRRQG